MNQREQKWEGQEITLAGIEYILRPDNADDVGRIYDKDSCYRSQSNPDAKAIELFKIEKSAKDLLRLYRDRLISFH